MIERTIFSAVLCVSAGLFVAGMLSCRPVLDDSRPPMELQPVVSALEGAGLRVKRVELEESGDKRYLPTPVRLSVDGYDRVWLYQYEEEPRREHLARDFDLFYDFTSDSYPILFVLDRTVILVRGQNSEAVRQIYTALWVLRPPHQIAPFSGPLAGPSALHRCQAVEVALVQLHWYSDRRPGCGDPEAGNVALVRIGDYLERFRIDEKPHRRLPHRDSVVWAVMDHPSTNGQLDDRWDVVLVDWWSGMVIGIDRDVSASRFDSLQQLSAPGPLVVEAGDGSQSSRDELGTTLSWDIPAPSEWSRTELTEPVSAFVIERAASADLAMPERLDAWRSLAVVRANDGWLISRGHPKPLFRIELASNRITYRDWEVVDGERYAYRIYGCTANGRRTAYSNVAEAIAGDPDRSTFSAFAWPFETILHGCPAPD